MSQRPTARAGFVLVAIALLALAAGPVRAQSPVTVNACEAVTINGHSYVQYDLTITNTTSNFHACSVQFVRPFPGDTPDDTCSVVASSAPPGWASYGAEWFSPCFDSPDLMLDPGESMSGFTLVLTHPCCWEVALHNALLIDDPSLGVVCLACPTAARGSSWGALKAVYR